MIEQPQLAEPEQKPEVAKPKDEPPRAKDEPPAGPLGTGIQGNGPGDGFGLGGGSGLGGGPGGNGRGGGSRWGWYAGKVQSKVADALRSNRKTRSANLSVPVKIWPDSTGRVTRATLAGTTGDAGLDAALKNEVLNGLQLPEPPPAGMPLPITLRINAKRPN